MLSNKEYHAMKDKISSSLIKQMAKSYAHAKEYLESEHEPTKAMELGTAVHTMVLELGNFNNEIAVSQKFYGRTKAGKAAKAEFNELHEGKLIIDQETFDTAQKMHDSIMSHPIASSLLTGGIAEKSIFFNQGSLDCKCRPDYLKDDLIVDLKTSQDASPSGFAKAVANFNYDIQQAFYEDGCDIHNFVFVVVESKPPYLTAVYRLKGEDVEKARLKYKKLLAGWDACLEFDNYPGYSNDIVEINLPGWYK